MWVFDCLFVLLFGFKCLSFAVSPELSVVDVGVVSGAFHFFFLVSLGFSCPSALENAPLLRTLSLDVNGNLKGRFQKPWPQKRRGLLVPVLRGFH